MIRDPGYHRETTIQLNPIVKPQGGDLLNSSEEDVAGVGGYSWVKSRESDLFATDTQKYLFTYIPDSGGLDFPT